MSIGEWISTGIGAFAVVLAALLAIWSTRQDQRRTEINVHLQATDAKVQSDSERLTRLEEGYRHLPTNETNSAAFRLLYDKLDTLKDQVSALRGTQELASAITVQLARIGVPGEKQR